MQHPVEIFAHTFAPAADLGVVPRHDHIGVEKNELRLDVAAVHAGEQTVAQGAEFMVRGIFLRTGGEGEGERECGGEEFHFHARAGWGCGARAASCGSAVSQWK